MGDAYQPTVTSYDYDAPLNEMGQPTPKYFALRDLLSKFQPDGAKLPDLPTPLAAIEIPIIGFQESAALFENLPAGFREPQPKPMEYLGQSQGFILYRTALRGHYAGKLTLWELHDYADIRVDDKLIGSLNRARKEDTIEIPKSDPPAKTLDILVEGMGHINFSQYMIDRKGITDRVTLNGMTLMDWTIHPLPMDAKFMEHLKFSPIGEAGRPETFYRGSFQLEGLGDTYLDMSGWKKGVVWVNGRNLGRYWEIGPQMRLFCPAAFLKKGRNEIIVFDLHRTVPAEIRGFKSLE
jgi:beta-galactosidase